VSLHDSAGMDVSVLCPIAFMLNIMRYCIMSSIYE
jgi:hypothetical protein